MRRFQTKNKSLTRYLMGTYIILINRKYLLKKQKHYFRLLFCYNEMNTKIKSLICEIYFF